MKWSKKELDEYREKFADLLDKIQVTNRNGRYLSISDGIKECLNRIEEVRKKDKKLIFVGNGGSAAIAIHQATDFLKQCSIRTYAPLDPSLLTCMGNDYGYSNVFAEPLKLMAKKGDIMFAISSSGRSENIIKSVAVVRAKKCQVITLSGFVKNNNPLCLLGDINFYVPSSSYRYVESAHLFICNWILDFMVREHKE